jgi:hypothetical protein
MINFARPILYVLGIQSLSTPPQFIPNFVRRPPSSFPQAFVQRKQIPLCLLYLMKGRSRCRRNFSALLTGLQPGTDRKLAPIEISNLSNPNSRERTGRTASVPHGNSRSERPILSRCSCTYCRASAGVMVGLPGRMYARSLRLRGVRGRLRETVGHGGVYCFSEDIQW